MDTRRQMIPEQRRRLGHVNLRHGGHRAHERAHLGDFLAARLAGFEVGVTRLRAFSDIEQFCWGEVPHESIFFKFCSA